MKKAITKHKKASILHRLFNSRELYLLLLPAVIYFALYHYWPMYGAQIAFRDFSPVLGITGSRFVGLKHFNRFFSSPLFGQLIGNTVILSLMQLILSFPLPIILALMLNEVKHSGYKKLVQNATYIPHFISTVVLCGMVINFLTAQGIINQFLKLLTGHTVDFLSTSKYFRGYYIISGIWKETGWSAIIYIAALSGISSEIIEAAEIDGASKMQRIFHINIPSIMPTVVILLIMNSGRVMALGYEKAYLLQNATNLEISEIISTYVYKRGLLNGQYSFSAAIDLFNSVINMILMLSVNYISGKLSETQLF